MARRATTSSRMRNRRGLGRFDIGSAAQAAQWPLLAFCLIAPMIPVLSKWTALWVAPFIWAAWVWAEPNRPAWSGVLLLVFGFLLEMSSGTRFGTFATLFTVMHAAGHALRTFVSPNGPAAYAFFAVCTVFSTFVVGSLLAATGTPPDWSAVFWMDVIACLTFPFGAVVFGASLSAKASAGSGT